MSDGFARRPITGQYIAMRRERPRRGCFHEWPFEGNPSDLLITRHDRRSDQRGLFPIGAPEFLTPGTVFVNLAIGDGERFVGLVVAAVIPFRDGDVFAAPLDMAHQHRLRVADPVTKRKIREHLAETAILARVVTSPFGFDVLILLGDGGGAEANDQGDEEKGDAFHVCRNGFA